MKPVIILMLLVISFIATPSAMCRTNYPATVDSKYLHSFSGGFEYHLKTHTWKMFLAVQPLKTAPKGGPLYFEATFENPKHGGLPFVVASSSLKANSIPVVTFDSPTVSGMVDGSVYQVTVQVYADEAHTMLLGTHKQGLVFHVGAYKITKPTP